MPRKPSAMRSVSMARRSTTAAAPHSAIISMPIEAISIEMKWSRSPMSKRRASANIAEIGEIDLVLGAHVTAAERGLLQRNAVLMALGDVEEGAAVGPEQPFVGREDHKIRIETAARPSPARRRCASRRSGSGALLPQRRADLSRGRSARRPTSAPMRSRQGRPAARPAARWPRAPPMSSRRRPAGGPSRR